MPYAYQVLFTILTGITMFLIDTTVVNVALAKLQAVFGVDVSMVQWAITGYALASGIVTPLAEYTQNRWGFKRVWMTSLISFTLASMLCGISPSFNILLVGRVIQGICGGLLLPLGISTIFRVFPPNQRGLAMGFMAIPIVAGPALGPTVGGYIVTFVDWRVIFFINLPIGILAVAMAWFLIRDDREEHHVSLDVIGAALSALGFGSILYGFTKVAGDGWTSLTVLGIELFGGLCLMLLFAHELDRDQPLLQVDLFAIPRFLLGNIITWVATFSLFGAEFLMPLYLQQLRGLSAFQAGLLLLPQGLSAGVVGPIAGRAADRFGVRVVALAGFTLLALNTWNLAHITLTTSFGFIQILFVLRGAALGCTLQIGQLVSLAAVPRKSLTNASSLMTAMRNVFQSIGVALLGSIVQTQTVTHTLLLSQQVTPSSATGSLVTTITRGLMARQPGMSLAAAQAQAAGFFRLGAVLPQATVMAFNDAYLFTFVSTIVALLLSFLLPGRGQTGRLSEEEAAAAMAG